VVTLHASVLFSRLSAEELTALHWVAQEQQFKAGDVIFREGDPGTGIYIVKEGAVEISSVIGGVRRVFAVIQPGDFFGEMAVIDYKPRSGSATVRVDTTVYFISRDEILKFIERSPVLAITLLRAVCNRLREFNRQHLRETVQAEKLATVGKFARSIIHDLKNPLNVIGLSADLAARDPSTSEPVYRALTVVKKQVDRISDLVAEVLEFSREHTSDTALTPTNYAEFAGSVLADARSELALRSVAIAVEEPVPAVTVRLQPKRLERVYVNLFQNAADSMPDGGKINVRFQSDLHEVVTEVSDTGPGIAPEILDRLFEPFATHGKEHGTGLGLSICQRILEDHHGWISARNGPGPGATFAFGLPL
jgi:signal transduction histidine kinase